VRKLFFIGVVFLLCIATAFAYDTTNISFYHSEDDDDLSGSNPLDLSDNENNGTTTGATTGVTGILNQAFSFDGSGDFVTLDENVSYPGEFAFSAWFTLDDLADGKTIASGSASSQNFIMIRPQDSPDTVEVRIQGSTQAFALGGNDLNTVDWFNIMVTRDASDNVEVYINNTQIGSTQTMSGLFEVASYGQNTDFASLYFAGDIDEIFTQDKAFSSADRNDIYNNHNAFNPFTASSNLTITASTYNSTQLLNFSAEVNTTGSISYYSTTTGSITTNQNDTNELVNITVYTANNLINQTFTDYNISNALTFNYSVLDIRAYDTIDNVQIDNFSVSLVDESLTFTINSGQTNVFADTGTYDLSYVAQNYFDANTTVTVAKAITLVNTTMFSNTAVPVNVYDIETGAILFQNVTITVQNSTFQEQSIINGTGSISNLVVGNEYTFIATEPAHETSILTKVFNAQTGSIDFYLLATGTAITFTVDDTSGAKQLGATIQVQRFVNGTNQLVGTRETDILGEATFTLNTSQTHLITVSKTGFETEQFTLVTVDDTEYVVTLSASVILDFDTSTSGVYYNYTPITANVTPTTNTFSWLAMSDSNSIDWFSIQAYNGTTQIGITNETTQAGGGKIDLTLDLSAYNNTNILLVYKFKKEGFEAQQLAVSYIVTDSDNYEGSLLQMKAWVQENVTVSMRITLWIIAILIFALIISVAVRGVENVAMTTGFALISAWLFSLNVIIIGIFATIIFFAFLASNGGGNFAS